MDMRVAPEHIRSQFFAGLIEGYSQPHLVKERPTAYWKYQGRLEGAKWHGVYTAYGMREHLRRVYHYTGGRITRLGT